MQARHPETQEAGTTELQAQGVLVTTELGETQSGSWGSLANQVLREVSGK